MILLSCFILMIKKVAAHKQKVRFLAHPVYTTFMYIFLVSFHICLFVCLSFYFSFTIVFSLLPSW